MMPSSEFLLALLAFISSVTPVSIWDPFCKADILYRPYVRVFIKGRSGTLLRDRGPGFIDLTGLKDIYVCTNGLVMLYYVRTREMGDILEHGNLHWTPHHCEMYNPSSNEGVPSDHPKKTLMSILLIGHPEDYRHASLQMFVAPYFDKVHGDYINLTSLIMMGTDGECIIEKGAEKARLRIRNVEPQFRGKGPYDPTRPPMFCQLDSQNYFGQNSLLAIGYPGKLTADFSEEPFFVYKEKKKSFAGTPFEKIPNYNDGAHPHGHPYLATGSAISPRFRPSSLKGTVFTDKLELVTEKADEVYAALINDRKMTFLGCLRYPDFSIDQMKIISEKKAATEQLDLSKEGLLIKETEPSFWAEKVGVPWPEYGETKTNEERYKIYLNVDVDAAEVESYADSLKKVTDAAADVLTKKMGKGDPSDATTAENYLLKEQILFSLWPFKKSYEELYKHVKDLEEQVKKVWEKLYTDNFEEVKPNDMPFPDLETGKLITLAYTKINLLKNISQANYDLRVEPYNRDIILFQEKTINETGYLNLALRKRSVDLGPAISNAEVLLTQYKAYKGLLKRSMDELQQAVKFIEKTGNPANYPGGDPFDKQFVDILIELTDPVHNDLTAHNIKEDKFNILKAKSCWDMPARSTTCNDIKPTSVRAGHLFQNRKGNTVPKFGREDSWRDQVFEKFEIVFNQACPYIGGDFVRAINNVIKGYLLAAPLGTGLAEPVHGTLMTEISRRYYKFPHQGEVYNMTNSETNTENITEFPFGKLPKMRPAWGTILSSLQICISYEHRMEFWHNEEGDEPGYITFRKVFPGNGSDAHFNVDDLMMLEKADMEYSFNWAIDMHWRIFATVLGICMPWYKDHIPHIASMFYSMYNQDFLRPLRQVWMSNRDNPVFQVIFGNYYARGKAEKWAKICMESSYMYSGADRNFRPPRSLYVNAFTEMNYFVTGPLAGTSGILSAVETPL